MSSAVSAPRTANGYFVVVASIESKVYSYTGGSGAGGSFVPGSFATVSWDAAGSGAKTLLQTAGTVLRDCGVTVVSSSRVFRRVQLIDPATSTGGVGGTVVSPGNQQDYNTGYIELAGGSVDTFAGAGTLAAVAYMPRFAF
jgi:hypothetical protein